MSSSDSSSDSFFSSFFSSSLVSPPSSPAAGAPPAAGAAPPAPGAPALWIRLSRLCPSRALAKRPGQKGSTSTLAALISFSIFSDCKNERNFATYGLSWKDSPTKYQVTDSYLVEPWLTITPKYLSNFRTRVVQNFPQSFQKILNKLNFNRMLKSLERNFKRREISNFAINYIPMQSTTIKITIPLPRGTFLNSGIFDCKAKLSFYWW